ncbi:hypothetical protein B1813_05315 [Saccharomonospora piscinae]|uniref:Putative zinc-finger domain-containing protein n=1 Tax=Saccharomonospora piscinae TaxID=687388 RepID=A0A1V9AAH7_SACPI|nr:zf-HC2 domain-containing protein [Saccharomonospora piscinae]OQO93934.1 hypothetical protein B1813_05315 [Saccharomonospora piscinae]
MDCSSFREALSARLDGEDEGLAPERVDRHLDGCASCRLWWERSTRLHRTMRLTEAPPVPDLSERIVTAAAPPRRERWAARVALAVVALAQSGLGVAQLLGVGAGHLAHSGQGAAHLGNESAAWNLAVGIGLLWASLRPASAGGQLPALTGFALVLAGVSAADLASGSVTTERVLTHGIMLAGLCLLFVVHRQSRTSGPAPTSESATPERVADDTARRLTLAHGRTAAPRDRLRRRPFARRRAA